jgi:hypothetical protein
MSGMIYIGPNPAIRLSRWAWLHVGRTRRLIGWHGETRGWVTTDPVSAVASSRPKQPPAWAVTVNGAQILLGEPGLPQDDGPLDAIDRLRFDPAAGIAHGAPITIVPWRSVPEAAFDERRIA